MSGAAQVVVAAIAAGTLVLIVVLVRRGALKERFALVWIGIGLGMVGLVLARPLLDRISEELGFATGTTTIFLLAILVLLGLVLHQSVIISGLEERTRDLAEAIALERARRSDEEPDEPQVGGE